MVRKEPRIRQIHRDACQWSGDGGLTPERLRKIRKVMLQDMKDYLKTFEEIFEAGPKTYALNIFVEKSKYPGWEGRQNGRAIQVGVGVSPTVEDFVRDWHLVVSHETFHAFAKTLDYPQISRGDITYSSIGSLNYPNHDRENLEMVVSLGIKSDHWTCCKTYDGAVSHSEIAASCFEQVPDEHRLAQMSVALDWDPENRAPYLLGALIHLNGSFDVVKLIKEGGLYSELWDRRDELVETFGEVIKRPSFDTTYQRFSSFYG